MRQSWIGVLVSAVSVGCDPPRSEPDAFSESADVGADARRVRRSDAGFDSGPDAPVDAPFPMLDCDDPSLWSRSPDRAHALRAISWISNCFDDIPSFYVPMHIDSWGWGPGCVRVHASSRDDLPVGTYSFPREGMTLGVAAPIELDVEVRGWVPNEDHTGWVLLSERGRHDFDPDPSFRVVSPGGIELGRDVVEVYDWAYLTSTQVRLIATPFRERPREGVLALGTLSATTAVITDAEPPVLMRLWHDLSPLTERPWPGAFDRDHVWILDFGVISGRTLLLDYGTLRDVHELPMVFDEVRRASEGHAFARVGDRGYAVGTDGVVHVGPTGVARVVPGGGFVDTEGRYLTFAGVPRALDPAIGELRGVRAPLFEGERGIEYVPFGAHVGPTVRLFDPESEGRATLPAPLGGALLERADGMFLYYPNPRLEGFCE